MFRTLCFGLMVAVTLPGQTAFSTFLNANNSIREVATDAQGYVYIFGETNFNSNGYPLDVYVARLDPASAKVIYQVELGGSANMTRAGGFTVDAAGNVYLAGYTEAADFPTVPAAANAASTSKDLAFAAKVNASGAIVYSVLFSSGVSAYPLAMAADSSGDAIISGVSSSAFPTTAGAYNNAWTSNVPFVTKLDPTGTKTIFSEIGVGGTSLAVDPAGDVYIAGTTGAPYGSNLPLYPATPGAFQTTYTPVIVCPPTPCMLPETLGQQYVTKLSADGSKLLYSTFITGSAGSYNAGMAVDAAGDVWVTGDTASADYPYTVPITATSMTDTFTTELDPTGSKVLLSVAEGVPVGTGNNLGFDPQGNILVVGTFPTPTATTIPPNVTPAPASPPTSSVASACLAGEGVYALSIGSRDGSVLGTRILPGRGEVGSAVDSQGNIYIAGGTTLPDIPLTPGFAYDTAVTERTVGGSFLERTNFAIPVSPLGCVTDSPTMAPLGPVAPGQLITLYGNGMGPAEAAVGITGGIASVPTSLEGVTVTFNGQPAPILYASSTQINVQTPFEIYQNPYVAAENVVMQVSYSGSVVATRLFAVTPISPSIFLGAGALYPSNYSAQPAFALNQDGSVNSAANPAAAGSQFTLFVNGLGIKSNVGTGVIVTNPGFIDSSAALFDGLYSLEVDNFTNQAGAISGIGQLTARVPENIASPQTIAVTFSMDEVMAGPLVWGGTAATEIPALVFVKP